MQRFLLLVLSGACALAQTPSIATVSPWAIPSGTVLCPGDIASITGTSLGGQSAAVTFGGLPGHVFGQSSDTQVVVEIPTQAPLGPTTVKIGSASANITLTQFAPSILPNGTFAPAQHLADLSPVNPTNPAHPSETIALVVFGLGPTNPAVVTGSPAPSNPNAVTTAKASVTVGGQPATVLGSYAQPGAIAGYEVDFAVPAVTSGGNLPLSVSIGGVTSNTVQMAVSTAPTVTSLANNYSYTLPGLPNYGIAQGSIFDIFGFNLGSSSTPLQAPPLTTTLAGTSVHLTVNGTTTTPYLYYVTPTQIAGILPSTTPAGNGTITVSTGGQTASASITVVPSAFGMLTLNGAGDGPAAAEDVNYNYLSFTNAANPGDYIILWGSGIGPVPVGTDEGVAQTPTNLNLSTEIDIGGMPAQIYYQGRSTYPGLDQLIAIVPSGVTPGCWVSVVVRSGTIDSNFATIPVAGKGSRTCADSNFGLTAVNFQSLASTGQLRLGSFTFTKLTDGSSNATTDQASFNFISVTNGQFAAEAFQNASPNSCQVFTYMGSPSVSNPAGATELDAGAQINVSGPTGKATLTPQPDGSYGAALGSSGTFISASSAVYNFDNGKGGAGVNAFTATASLSGAPLPTWSNLSAFASPISRSKPMTVTWTANSQINYVEIIGASTTPSGAGAWFNCTAPATAGSFSVPAAVLAALPASGQTGSGVQVSFSTAPQAVYPPGLDYAFAALVFSTRLATTFQ